MTILFSNNSYKYEIEATVKLFLPFQKFAFLYDDFKSLSGDFIAVRIKYGKKFTYAYCCVKLNDAYKRLACKIDNSQILSDPSLCEYTICKLVFLCLKTITGFSPEWGMLTGIRPVRKIITMLNNGMSENDITAFLSDKYFVSKNKIQLAFNIAKTQIPILNQISPKSVSLYVSIPFCPTRCSYCSFVSHSIENAHHLIPDYVNCLCKELTYIAKYVDKYNLSINSIYIGGGTPTSLSHQQLAVIMKCINDNFNISQVKEYNVEAGRADTITNQKLEVIKYWGANRISINPQTFNNTILQNIGRQHTAEQTVNAYISARNIGFDNINMDIIAGLPQESLQSFISTINTAIKLAPESITVHALTVKRSADLYETDISLLETPIHQMVEYGRQTLLNNGYLPYYLYRQKNTLESLENIGYSFPNKEGLYNIFIMDDSQSIIGAGCAASTKLVFPDKRIKRIHNYKFPYEYISKFNLLMHKKLSESLPWRCTLRNL